MTLTEEIKGGKKKSLLKKIFFLIMILGISYGTYAYFLKQEEKVENVEKKSFSVKKSDLKTYIEADGKVLLKDDLSLDFALNGTIKKIYKKEGDFVKEGELIAEIDDSYLKVDIDKAKIALKTAQDNYNLKKRGSQDYEIDIQSKQVLAQENYLNTTKTQTEIDLQIAIDNEKNLKDNLENTKKQNKINLLNSKNILQTAQLDLETAKNDLNTTISSETQKYKDVQNKIIMEAGQLISQIEKNLYDIDLLLGITQANKYKNDSFELYLGAKNTNLKTTAENSFLETKKSFDSFYVDWKNFRQNTDLTKLDEYTTRINEVGSMLNKTLNYTLEVLKNSITSTTFMETTLDNYISTFEKSLSDNKDIVSNFVLLIQTKDENKTLSDEKITNLKSQITTLEQKLKIAENSLNKTILENDISINLTTQKLEQAKKELENTKIKNEALLSKETSNLDISKTLLDSKKQVDSLELEPLINAINLAEKNLQEAKMKLNDTKLYSPVFGKIVDISGKVGELSNNIKTPFVTIINPNVMYVESFVEESDIVKVKENQEVNINFDSIDSLTMTGKVIYINDKANIDSNGVVSYEVKILFEVNDNRVKDSMTVGIEFITKQVKNILVIPVQAVKTINKKPSVILETGDYKEVITGFTDGKMVEVISGLKLGDKIVY